MTRLILLSALFGLVRIRGGLAPVDSQFTKRPSKIALGPFDFFSGRAVQRGEKGRVRSALQEREPPVGTRRHRSSQQAVGAATPTSSSSGGTDSL